ncbi:hypothetical protein RCL1_001330 [Eukaryota sp. TZLM3-RCL]
MNTAHSDFFLLHQRTQRLRSQCSSRCGLANFALNRYNDVIPHDESLVLLGSPFYYINASYCHSKQYIATQAPLPHTFAHFWHMVYETDSRVIVALTDLSKDCYFPNQTSQIYGRLQVDHVSTQPISNDLILRVFNLSCLSLPCNPLNASPCTPIQTLVDLQPSEEPSKLVYHYQFLGWPDAQTPSNMIDFDKLIALLCNHDSRMIVHCMAGVGRTGTLITILEMIKSKNQGVLNEFDLIQFILTLRRERSPLMVETIDQFCFLRNYLQKLLKM